MFMPKLKTKLAINRTINAGFHIVVGSSACATRDDVSLDMVNSSCGFFFSIP